MSSKYDTAYSFRMANINDTDNIMHFIREEWDKNHILGHNKELFLWQYGKTEYGDCDTINIVLMEEKKSGLICGMMGFIPYSNNQNELHISTSMGMVKSDNPIPMAGVELIRRQQRMVGEKANFASGTNPKTILPIYERVFKHYTGYMQQYYILNTRKDTFNIASIDRMMQSSDRFDESGLQLENVDNFEDMSSKYDLLERNRRMSIKSPQYIKKRFFDHPIYHYKKWILNFKGVNVGALFGREITLNNSIILRLVDYRGNLKYLSCLGTALHDLMWTEGYEYIDLMVSDCSDLGLDRAGFSLLDPDGDIIIPHYFEPFIRKNIKNYYQNNGDIVVFKADGDQDRPNRI